MTVKMVVPTAGRRDTMGAGKRGMADTPLKYKQGRPKFP